LEDVPETPPWTKLTEYGEVATFYIGGAEVDLYPSETTNYRDNLATGVPQLWVVLRRTEAEPPFMLHTVTADPAEGEGYTQVGDDLVEPVPMPDVVFDAVAAFIAEHHVERVFFKRKRDRANPEALAQRGPLKKGRK
jgi:hypothetical protein